MLFFFSVLNRHCFEWFTVIMQKISWIVEIDFQGGRDTIDSVMLYFDFLNDIMDFPTLIDDYF